MDEIKINNRHRPWDTANKFLVIFLAVAVVILLITRAHEADTVSFEFRNSTDKKVLVYLYWIDHPFDYLYPANMAGGEMTPGKVWKISHDYKPGE